MNSRITRRSALALVGSAALPYPARAFRLASSIAQSAPVPTFASLPIGGGGFVTGISVAPDGTMVCRADVYGAWIMNTSTMSAWTPLVTVASMPSSMVGPLSNHQSMANSGNLGVSEVAIAHSNTQVLYIVLAGKALVSTSQGASWTIMSNFPAYTSDANSGSSIRYRQRKMAVDPNNPDHVIFNVPGVGVYRTTNGRSGASATFTEVITATGGSCGISFDASSGTTGGLTNNVYVANASGVYLSTNQGQSFSLIASSPTNATDGVASSGVYYAATGSGLLSYTGAWNTLNSSGWGNVDINPNSTTWIAGMANNYGNYSQGTITGGGTGVTIPSAYISSGDQQSGTGENTSVPPSDVGWLGLTHPVGHSGWNGNWASGGLVWDPINTNRVWMSNGYGVVYFDESAPTASSAMVWTTHTAGIEVLVTQAIVSAPGGNSGSAYCVIGVEDQQVVYDTNFATPLSSTAPSLGSRGNNSAAWSIDASQSNAGVIAALSTGYYVGTSGNYSGVSTNYGASWTQFSTKPTSNDQGNIACSDANHVLVIPYNGSTAVAPIYTANGGSSAWSTVSGLPSIVYINGNSIFTTCKVCCNDAAGFFYVFAGSHGTYKSNNANDASAFTNVSTTNLTASSSEFYQCQLQACPGNAGWLAFCQGAVGSNSNPAYYTTNGAVTWTAIPNVEDVWCCGFGAVAPGFTKPTFWFIGWANPGSGFAFGLWRCRDFGTFSDLAVFDYTSGIPNGAAQPVAVCGDGNVWNICYIGFWNAGAGYGVNLT
jgi:hypothetical protein